MTYLLLKLGISAAIIVAVSEIAKRSSLLGGLLLSLPLTSLLAFLWLYYDTHDPAKVSALATSTFWLVLPSLVWFLALPWLLTRHVPFYSALLLASLAMLAAYGAMLLIAPRLGIEL